MIATPHIESVPIEMRADGVIRVGGTRVTLDVVINSFNRGETPEQIVENYSVLHLADVYAVFTYYLRHKSEVDQYIQEREQRAEALRHTVEARHPEMAEIRSRLLARQAAAENATS
jgi:uncharacterized protein (DUF433 family)